MRVANAGLDGALRRAKGGDSSGFDALFRAHADALAAYLRAQGVTDAEGLANEVFLRAFRNIQTVEGDAERFRAWLFRIAHNAAVDEHRRRRRRPSEVPLHGEELWTAGDVEREAMDALDHDVVRRLFEQLSPDQRDVLLLRVLGDLTIAQTAAVLDKSQEAVKALQHRAVANLRRLLEPTDAMTP